MGQLVDWSARLLATAALTVGLGVSGCASDNGSRPMEEDRRAEREASADYSPQGERGRYETERRGTRESARQRPQGMIGKYRPDWDPATQGATALSFPTGDDATSAVKLFQVMPREVRAGQPFAFEYHVVNLTGETLNNVTVMLEETDNLEVMRSTPSGTSSEGMTVWNVGNLGPGEAKVIELTGTAEDVGMASNCISVAYNAALCAAVRVVNPELQIAKTATRRTLVCDPITLTYRVTNSGSGVAEDVVLRDDLPAGLTAEGSRRVERRLGNLGAGESREVTVVVEASRAGEFSSGATAMATGGLEASSDDPETLVVRPELSIECEARERQFFDRNVEYSFVVTNDGDGEARDATATVTFPAAARFVRGSSGVQAGAGRATFALGTIAPEQSREFSVTLTTSTAGQIRAVGRVDAYCAEPVQTACTTEFEGIPAILLELVDLVDPVEIGTETTYVVVVTNQGSAPGNNIDVRAQLPDELEFVSASGATEANVRGQTITFDPVRTLAPKATAQWRIVARAVGEGSVRFALEMDSDEFEQPVQETEATNLYE